MLEPKPIFKPYQFVQQIEFKNKDIHRHDLGLDHFGFIKTSHVIERTMIEYEIVFASSNEHRVLEYSLRPLSDDEIESRLEQILKSPEKYQTFIDTLQSEPNLQLDYPNLFCTQSLPLEMALE
ncbi:MAG: hypothetical protein PUC22_09965 [Turicibacter sp.]|nr:hypothetical protein [Turicibacter sp.]